MIGYSKPQTVLNPQDGNSHTKPGLYTDFFAQLKLSQLVSIKTIRAQKLNIVKCVIDKKTEF